MGNYAFAETLTGSHMVFLSGPLQSGKTVLSERYLEKGRASCLTSNWDDIV